MIDLVGERGYENTNLETVLDRAEVERSAFERHFASFEDCVVETWKKLTHNFLRRSDAAFKKGGNWREGMRVQAWDLCRFIEEDLNRIRFLIELSFAEELVQANRDLTMSRLADYVHLGRFERPEAAAVPRDTAEGLIGAIWNGIAFNVKEPDLDGLHKGIPQILYLMVFAYLGQEAAEEELRRGPEDIARYERGEI